MTEQQHEMLLYFYDESDMNKGNAKCGTMHGVRSADLNKLVYKWFKQYCSEGVPIFDPIVMEKVKQFHQELDISEPCEFFIGWFYKLKLCHSIHYLKMSGVVRREVGS